MYLLKVVETKTITFLDIVCSVKNKITAHKYNVTLKAPGWCKESNIRGN